MSPEYLSEKDGEVLVNWTLYVARSGFTASKGQDSQKNCKKKKSAVVEVRHQVLKMKDFNPLLQKVSSDIDPSTIRYGFKACGIVERNQNLVELGKTKVTKRLMIK